MTSLLTKSALEKLPAEVRDHIIVENETGYSITLSMTIGDFERLVAPHAAVGFLRDEVEELERELDAAECAAEVAEAEQDDAIKHRDEIAAAVQTYLGVLDIDHPVDSPQAEALKALEDLL